MFPVLTTYQLIACWAFLSIDAQENIRLRGRRRLVRIAVRGSTIPLRDRALAPTLLGVII
jgi:hypothetical protein